MVQLRFSGPFFRLIVKFHFKDTRIPVIFFALSRAGNSVLAS
jgi:hypothetical protein